MSETQVRISEMALDVDLAEAIHPASPLDKEQVAEYYRRVAPILLPHLQGHPVAVGAYPYEMQDTPRQEQGYAAPLPSQLHVKQISLDHHGSMECCLINDQAELLCVGEVATAGLHMLLSREEASDRPTALVLQLAPTPPASMLDCIWVALDLRDMFLGVGLNSWAKTCGKQGLHLCIPLNTPVTFAQTRLFARMVAETYADRYPKAATANLPRQARPGQVVMDWRLNQAHQTFLSVYSLCACGQPSVSTPVTWEEIEERWQRQDSRPLEFGPDEVWERIAQMGDVFAQVLKVEQSLPI